MKRIIRTIIIGLLFLLAVPGSGFPEKPEDDIVLRAITEELARAEKKLVMEGMGRPYYLAARVVDRKGFYAEASFGAIQKSEDYRNCYLQVEVRVGDYGFDNSNFIGEHYWKYDWQEYYAISLDRDYDAIRQAVWTGIDSAYKKALEDIAKKKAYLEKTVVEDRPEDFSREKKNEYFEPAKSPENDYKPWAGFVKKASMIFRNYPEILDSNISLSIDDSIIYFASTEGFRVRRNAGTCHFHARAEARADDGSPLSDYVCILTEDSRELPPQEEVMASLGKMADRLVKTRTAEKLTDYVGPVLFEGEAAAQFFSQVLCKNFSGPAAPVIEVEHVRDNYKTSQFESRFKRKILPEFLSVFDDPRIREFAGRALAGRYEVDSEGLPAERVNLVENGILKNFLMSRKPTKKIKNSNGHGRKALEREVQGRIGNTFIVSSKKEKPEAIRKRLLKLCRAQEMEFGIIVRKLGEEGNEVLSLSKPIEIYKVYTADGREVPVRGLEFAAPNIRTLKDIIATGSGSFVYNFFSNDKSGMIPASVVAPDMALVEELELKKETGEAVKPPLLKNPFFEISRKLNMR